MTTKVTVTHDQPGYPSVIQIIPLNADGTPQGSDNGTEHVYAKTLNHGEQASFYLHSGCTLLVAELPPALRS